MPSDNPQLSLSETENAFKSELRLMGSLDDYAEQQPRPLAALELLDRLHSSPLNSPDWVFRGQSYPWPLQPSLDRIADPVVVRRFSTIQNPLITEFMSRAHQYTENPPSEDDELGCLALMQHYGAPTRLLDWSISPFVAAFFAVEKPPQGDPLEAPVIWAVNRRELVEDVQRVIRFEDHSMSPDQIAKAEEFLRTVPPPADPYQPREITFLMRRAPFQRPLVVPAQPARMSERLSVQQGVFLRVNPPNWGFEDALRYVLATRKEGQLRALHKLRIDPRGRLHLLKELHRMNISAESLFPGLDGFARSLMVKAEVLAEPWRG
jgi:hypothetical protein